GCGARCSAPSTPSDPDWWWLRMSADSSPLRPIATWSPARSAWETTETALCGHSALYSQTWPTSGMTLRGVAYELPTWEPPTDGSASLSSPGLLPTPMTVNRTSERAQTGRETSGPSRGGPSFGLEDVVMGL